MAGARQVAGRGVIAGGRWAPSCGAQVRTCIALELPRTGPVSLDDDYFFG
jgi:hypothetical protein